MIQIAICDDQPEHCRIAEKEIEACMRSLHVPCRVFVFHTGKALEDSGEDFDVLFMDIEMGKENGLNVAARYVKTRRTRVVLLTSHVEEMANGYKIRAFRFLTKPLNRELLAEALQSVLEEMAAEETILLMNDRNEQCPVYLSDIVYAEAGAKSCCVRTVKEIYTYPHGIQRLQEILDRYDFYMPHRSYLMNLNHIAAIDKYITMVTGERIPVSRGKQKEFLEYYHDFTRRKLYGD